MIFSPHQISFCLLSFEGPDRYSLAGGLGVRITHLAETLAGRGFDTHLIFVGDPAKPAVETRLDGQLTLHRWGQWISAHHPIGVYDGEEGKLADFNRSVPPFLMEQFIKPALAAGRLPVILAEEWHTAQTMITLAERLEEGGLQERCVLFWNANNTTSFHRVDWPRLNQVTQITTVSRYMKHLMWRMDLNPLVIPNGIPSALLEPLPAGRAAEIRSILDSDDEAVILFKVGRFDPAKRWLMAIEAAAQIKAAGHRVAFPLRGGIEPHGVEVFARAGELGLTISHIGQQPQSWEELLAFLQAAPPADIYHLDFFMDQSFLRPFYAAADAVLANSGHEPFGLVGLEAMAAGGLVFTGTTGEEYTLGGRCAVALDTERPAEIATQVLDIRGNQARSESMRRAAHDRAAAFTWEQISDVLMEKVKFVAQLNGALSPATRVDTARVRDLLIYVAVDQPDRLPRPAEPGISLKPSRSLPAAVLDDSDNEAVFSRVAAASYYPSVNRFSNLLDQGFKLAIGFSSNFLEQVKQWDEALLVRFIRLVQHEQVALVLAEPFGTHLPVWDLSRLIWHLGQAAARLETLFGVQPAVVDVTGWPISADFYHALDQDGFQAAIVDGGSQLLDWRQPAYVYHHNQGEMKLLPYHVDLSADVGQRFSDHGWEGWPLLADRYAGWLAGQPGQLVLLRLNLETFGERHPAETGIFDFLSALPAEVRSRGLAFATPAEALDRYGRVSHDLPLSPLAELKIGYGGQDPVQTLSLKSDPQLLQLMMRAYEEGLLNGDADLVKLSRRLSGSEFFPLRPEPDRSEPVPFLE